MHPHVAANLDKFKATFQKPCQIYRFLRVRWYKQPLFLQRTLSYVNKHRAKRYFGKQKLTSIDKIAKRLLRDASKRGLSPSRSILNSKDCAAEEPGSSNICFFNWICDDPEKTSQKTKTRGYICPWCDNNNRHLDTLMMHLKCCHSRFNYNLIEDSESPLIEMTLNQSYDGSYRGFKFPGHDVRKDFKFVRRHGQPQTLFTYLKPRKKINSNHVVTYPDHELETFADDGEADVDVSGRLYYHTSTCLPVKPNESDIDSEADADPEWLEERTQLMIDEFTDVNEGEKQLLKMWNLHMMKNYKFRSDSMIRQACLDFVHMEGANILSKNLTKNFTLHLANLFDFGLIGSKDIIECIRALRKKRPSSQSITTSPTRAANKIKHEQRNEHCQNSPPTKRALLNSQVNHSQN